MKLKKTIILFIILLTVGCENKENTTPEPSEKNAFVMYCASACNLYYYIQSDVNEIVNSYVKTDEKDIYVFMKKTSEAPILYKIEMVDGAYALSQQTVYDEDTNTASATTLAKVLADVSNRSDVIEITDVLMSSHGTSWLPVGYAHTSPYNSWYSEKDIDNSTVDDSFILSTGTSYSFGADNNFSDTAMTIAEIASALEPYDLNTLFFDSCFMGSIEALYELRGVAKYIVASPAEVLNDGYNYTSVAPYFTSILTLAMLDDIARLNYEKYASKTSSDEQTATFTVTVTENLDALALTIDRILSYNSDVISSVSPSVYYDGSTKYACDYFLYLDAVLEAGSYSGNEELYDELVECWNAAFPYYYHTDYLFSKADIRVSYGVGAYVYRSSVNSVVNAEYLSTSWGELVGGYY